MQTNKNVERERMTMADVRAQYRRIETVLVQARAEMLAPENKRLAPYLPSPDVMRMLDVTRHVFLDRIARGVYPPPTARLRKQGNRPESGRRLHAIADVRAMMRAEGKALRKPAGANAKAVLFGNSKGGVGKTTVTVSFAQRAARMGADVLLVDLDPQGSATTMCGFLPEIEIGENETMLATMPHHSNDRRHITDVIRPTYWPGLDIVGANTTLGGAELLVPRWVAEHPERSREAYGWVSIALADVLDRYDIIVIDTPPAVGYLALNGMIAADAMVIPTGLSSVDIFASGGFWKLLCELAPDIEDVVPDKSYDFVRVVANKTHARGTSALVRDWLAAGYGRRLSRNEIPDTRAVDSAGVLASGTVYDLHGVRSLEPAGEDDVHIHRQTLERALAAFDAFGEEIDELLRDAWRTA